MPRMSVAERTAAAQLDQLKASRSTGCLIIESASGLECRVYLLMGRVFHADGPSGEGDAALADALSWPDVTLSFDERAILPNKQTISPADMPVSGPPLAINNLSDDPRLTKMSVAALGGGCAMVLVPLGLLGVALVLKTRGVNSDGLLNAAVLSLPALAITWIATYIAFRVAFIREAVSVPGGLVKSAIPRVVDTASGAIAGEAESVIKMQTHCLTGRVGKCRIEFFADGLQIWRGRDHPEPRWQFAYRDLLQAELVNIVFTGGRSTTDQYFVRLIAAQPRMAFLFGSSWFANRKAFDLLKSLSKHKVTTLSESIDA